MIEVAITFAASCYGIALALNLWRIVTGPDAADRILALDTMVINVIALIVIYGIIQSTAIFFEAAMLISMPQGMPFTQPFFDVMYDIIY